MRNIFGDEPPRRQPPEFRVEDLDVSRLAQLRKWILLVGLVILAWIGLNWLRTFYIDWLWFSELGYESVLLKGITTQMWLFLLGVLLFVLMAGPNLYLAYRHSGRPRRSRSPATRASPCPCG